ncbi:MAG TPA: MarR family transcriptional regulator [Mycobacteriales bacterium]|jgi:DNA-binding MarR family transcriptional regulator|nr:MarR family transcriptional regulator [Mycobacteriales bacterium]
MEPAVADCEVSMQIAADAIRLRLAIGRLARLQRQLEPGGLTPSQLSVMWTVSTVGTLRMSDLAAREGVAAPTMTRVVAALEETGLLQRSPDPDDGRSSLVSLTETGRRRLETVRERRDAMLARRMAALPEPSRRALIDAVPALEELLSDDLDR